MDKYEIQTVGDIYWAVNKDNVEGFLIDFEGWIRLIVELKDNDLAVGMIDVDKFIWNDDGEWGKLKAIHIEIP